MGDNDSNEDSSQSKSQNSNSNSNNNNFKESDDPHATENGSSWLGFWKASSPRYPVSNAQNTTSTPPTFTGEPSNTDQVQRIDIGASDNVNNTNTELGQQIGDKNDDNDKTDNNTITPPTGSPSQGLWSWLGYSSTNNAEQSPQDRSNGSSSDNDNNSTNQSNNDNNNTNQSNNDNNNTNQSNIPTPTDNGDLQPPAPSRASWHSYFFSTNTTTRPESESSTPENSDSVIIEPTTSTQDDLLKSSSNPPATPPSGKKWANGDNVVLPSIKSQFSPPPLPPQTLFTKALSAISAIFSQSPGTSNQNQHQGLVANIIKEMTKHPETVAGKKIVIIGVHGWFPTKLVRSVVGEPTGTSSKFCEQTAKAVRQYFEQEHGLVLPPECMTLIPLQWEGKVQERVEKLYSFLVDNPASLDALQSADIIFWTTHSQGTPVSAILLDRLIQENFIRHKHQALCLLAMAGIAHGPFASLKGSLIVKYFEADAARELFDFMDPASEISRAFRQAMASILQHGIKTILVGSMQDQVVPLYSAIMVATDHPNILRAIYIDGHIYSPDDFLINLIVFALRLRNAGLSDHGLLLHISDVLAGNLYAWEGGHSTIYEETDVYALAPRYLFDTCPLGGLLPMHQEHPNAARTPTSAVEAKSTSFKAKVRLNPYFLTWAMRGIFDDPRVIQVFGDELDRLRNLFDQWHPTSSKLREIKFRLEPIKARL